MGKYRIASFPRKLAERRYTAQVSIASGKGSASTDRVFRFVDEFPTHAAAASYALLQGIEWVREATRPQCLTN